MRDRVQVELVHKEGHPRVWADFAGHATPAKAEEAEEQAIVSGQVQVRQRFGV